MSRYHHLAHLKDVPIPKVGDYVKRGTLIGYVGNTGNSMGAHLHYEIRKAKPPTWTAYVQGMSQSAVAAQFQNPAPFIQNGYPADFTYKGNGYLQWTGKVWHTGIDINSPDDFGKPVYAPVNGRVVFAEGKRFLRNVFGKLFPSFFNNGWGNHIHIEQDEANSGIKIPT